MALEVGVLLLPEKTKSRKAKSGLKNSSGVRKLTNKVEKYIYLTMDEKIYFAWYFSGLNVPAIDRSESYLPIMEDIQAGMSALIPL